MLLNKINAANAFTVGFIGALMQALVLLPQDLPWKIMVSVIGLSFIGPFAVIARLPIPGLPNGVQPVVNVEHTDTTTVTNNPAPAAPPAPAAAEPPAVNVTARLPRARSGRFERTGTIVKPPPVDVVSDS